MRFRCLVDVEDIPAVEYIFVRDNNNSDNDILDCFECDAKPVTPILDTQSLDFGNKSDSLFNDNTITAKYDNFPVTITEEFTSSKKNKRHIKKIS